MMTQDQAGWAVPLLNTYAYGYLGLSANDVSLIAGRKKGIWSLIVATAGETTEAADFDAAKEIIDRIHRDKKGN